MVFYLSQPCFVLSCLERGSERWSRLLSQNTGVDNRSIQGPRQICLKRCISSADSPFGKKNLLFFNFTSFVYVYDYLYI